jgi:hypothetical protein
MYNNPWEMFNSGAQLGFIKGTKVTLTNDATVSNIYFYSHAAQGNIRLAIYDNATPNNALWQSGALSNTAAEAWLAAPIAAGAPATMTLVAGTYWLAWQVDTTYDVPSYAPGAPSDGFAIRQNFGSFPVTLSGAQSTSETWSIYFDYAPPPAPFFTGLAFQSGGALELQLSGGTSLTYTLMASTNLTTWISIGSALPGTNGSFLFQDTNTASFPARFYRAH